MIKILFLGANPTGTTQLALTQEVQAIKQHLRGADHGRQFQVEQEWAVKISDLNAALLRHRPDIVHFSGHGSPAGELILETESGTNAPVKPDALSNLFRILKRNIRCIVLNACFSAPQAGALAQHIDCVVGMTKAVGDKGAIAFAWAFYEALGFNSSVQEAFDLGCNQVDLGRLPDKDTPRLIPRTGIKPEEMYLLRQEGPAEDHSPKDLGFLQQGGSSYALNISGGSHGAIAVGAGARAEGAVNVGTEEPAGDADRRCRG